MPKNKYAMGSKININGHDIRKTRISANEYEISVFRSERLGFQFKVSLQPTGKEDVLPTYQLNDKSQTIPSWLKENMERISEWIKKEEN